MTSSAVHPPFFCLVVEDCDHDYQTLERLLRRSQAPLEVVRCAVGDEVITMLHQSESCTANSPALPAVIILDLGLSGQRDGREVLSAIRKHPHLKRTPLVVFSASTDPVDIAWCYRHGASAYQVKNTSLMSFRCVADLVVKYWSGDGGLR